MTRPHNSAVDGLEIPDAFVLPEGVRLYSPPGAIRMPETTFKKFRPMHENSQHTKHVFDTLLEPSRQAADAASAAQTVEFTPYQPDERDKPSFPNKALPVKDPADNAGNLVDGVLFIEDDGTHQYLNLEENPKRQGTYIALGEDGQPLLDGTGPKAKHIITDADGHVLPPKETWFNKVKGKLANSDGAQGDDDPVTVYTKEGIPLGDFDVVAPGHTPSDGRGRRGNRIAAYLAGAGVLAGAFLAVAGVMVGRSAVPAEGQITPEEAENFHLAQFPTNAAAAFGEHYLTLCLTHPQYKEDIESRNEMMAGMEAEGVATNCGWDKGGQAVAVNSVTFNGQVEEREEFTREDGSRVAYMGFFVTMSDGRHFTATLPIWSGTNEQQRPAYSIVGPVGMSAATAVGTSPDMSFNQPMDRALAGELEPTLSTFFDAWADSDAQGLDAILSTDATGEARSGMDGAFADPEFTDIKAYPARKPDKTDGDTATWNYQQGDRVYAFVNLTWNVSDEAGGHEQPTGYRVGLVYNGGKWEVESLDSGVVTTGGGGGDSSGSKGSKDPNAKNDSGNVGGGFSGGFSPLGEGDSDKAKPVEDSDSEDSSSGGSAADHGFSDTKDNSDSKDSSSGRGDGPTQKTPGATANESLGGATA